MTAPICHGTAGGCVTSHWPHLVAHADDCPTLHCIGCPQDVDGPASIHYTNCPLFTPPTKRTMGQCSEECTRIRYAQAINGDCGHIAACPALYPLQPQPGDEKDALTRLTMEIRVGYRMDGSDGGEDGWETRCLDLISEAREEQRTALSKEQEAHAITRGHFERMAAREKHFASLIGVPDGGQYTNDWEARAESIRRASALITTLNNTQSEVRQQALKEGREQGHMDAIHWMRARAYGETIRKLTDAMADALDALRGDS